MRTTKAKKQDGYHCFYCNARVEKDADRCPACGSSFVEPETKPAAPNPKKSTDRVKRAFRSHRKNYWLPLAVLAVCVVLLVTLFRPRHRARPLLSEPSVPRPQYQVTEIRDLSNEDVNRLSVFGLVRPDMPDESLKAVLDWMLYSALDEHNRIQNRSVRVAWAYLLEDTASQKSGWQAMAVWTDPNLKESLKPARIGGDATSEGPVQYDFTNPILPNRPDQNKGGTK